MQTEIEAEPGRAYLQLNLLLETIPIFGPLIQKKTWQSKSWEALKDLGMLAGGQTSMMLLGQVIPLDWQSEAQWVKAIGMYFGMAIVPTMLNKVEDCHHPTEHRLGSHLPWLRVFASESTKAEILISDSIQFLMMVAAMKIPVHPNNLPVKCLAGMGKMALAMSLGGWFNQLVTKPGLEKTEAYLSTCQNPYTQMV